MSDGPLTREQFLAARMLIARLRSEAAFEPFDFDELGIEWLATDDVVCAQVVDTGELLRLGDVFYAAVVMLWSLILAQADDTNVPPLDIVGNLGVGLALHEPT